MDEQIYNTTWSLLDSNPQLQKDIESVLEIDSQQDQWEFDDIEIDSGTFGKLVDRGVIQKDSGAYTVADRTAVTEAIADYQDGTKQTAASQSTVSSGTTSSEIIEQLQEQADTATEAIEPYLRQVNWNVIGLMAALLSVAGMRMLISYDVFREDNILSPANDPYYYRYVQGEMLEHADGITDIGALTEIGEEGTRPLTHTVNWLIPELLGGSQAVADWTAALLPVILAVLAGAMIYMIAVKVTADARVGVLAVVFYAIAPVHLVYTSVGFLEHRAHQYFWLLVMAFSLVWFAVDLRERLGRGPSNKMAVQAHLHDRRTWVITGVFTLTVAMTPHFWGGSPLHFIPVAGYIAVRVLMDARNDVSPLKSLTPVLAGLGVGGILAYIPHYVWGWHSEFVVLTPLLVLAGSVIVALYAEVGMRQDISATTLLAGEVAIGIGTIVAFRTLLPEEFSAARQRADALFFREGAIETQSLFGSVPRALVQIGPSFYIGIIGLVIGILVIRQDYRPSWLLLTVFTTYYLILAGLQMRFAAHLVLFVPIFSALAVVYLFSKATLMRPVRAIVDVTSSTATTTGAGIIRGVQSLSRPKNLLAGLMIGVIILTLISGSFLGIEGILDDITHEERYDAAMEINEHAEELDRDYPENYVLSSWGNSRMYNYFVNGEARGYGYAQSTFTDFMIDEESPDDWYNEFEDRVGYVVVPPAQSSERMVHHRLWQNTGLGNDSLSHYQFLGYMGGNRMFAVVDGATIKTENSSEQITAQLQKTVDGSKYQITETGEVTVAYEGYYAVEIDDSTKLVEVNESQIYNGDTIEISAD